jgi:hypothetical protein
MIFRTYSCDCIGFEVTDDEGNRHAFCVWSCDAPVDAPVGLWERPGLLEKTSEPVPFVRNIELLDALSRCISDGQRFREVRSALGIKG